MLTDRGLIAITITGFAIMGVCLLGIAYSLVIVSQQLAHVTDIANAILKLH